MLLEQQPLAALFLTIAIGYLSAHYISPAAKTSLRPF
jgi:hypothetical protein